MIASDWPSALRAAEAELIGEPLLTRASAYRAGQHCAQRDRRYSGPATDPAAYTDPALVAAWAAGFYDALAPRQNGCPLAIRLWVGTDPRDPRPEDTYRHPIFRDHNCWKCRDGMLPCARGYSLNCEFPHARND